jgi:uncharacterized membrane protein YraQ (UPF0718 family)
MTGAFAFWIAVAAFFVAGSWRRKHTESAKQETMRLIIEKNPNLDAEQLKEILYPPHPELPAEHPWFAKPDPNAGYKMLRIFGTIILFVAAGLSIAGIWRGMVLGIHEESVVGIVTAIPIIALVGAGLIFCSRFVTPPPKAENKDK